LHFKATFPLFASASFPFPLLHSLHDRGRPEAIIFDSIGRFPHRGREVEDKKLRTSTYRCNAGLESEQYRRGRAVACRLRDFHRQTHALITEHRIRKQDPGIKC
jgi:hypothetical protein